MKVACTVWSGGKDGDCIKILPIAIEIKMTVKDLIEELEAYDESLPVYFQDDYYDTCERILYVNYEEGVVVLR